MRIRFRRPVAVPGGPQYTAGEVIDTDPHLLTEARAVGYCAHGDAEEVSTSANPSVVTASSPVLPKAPEEPPVHRMMPGPPKRK